MNINEARCPSCSAPLQLVEGADNVTCSYCGVTSVIEYSGGNAVLHAVDRLQVVVEHTGAETQAAIHSASQSNSQQFQYLQLTNAIAAARTQLMAVESEIRTIERGPASRTSKKQLKELTARARVLQGEIAALEAQLNSGAGPEAAGQKKKGVWIGMAILVLAMCGICSIISALIPDSYEVATTREVAEVSAVEPATKVRSAAAATSTRTVAPTTEPTSVPNTVAPPTEPPPTSSALPQATVLRNANVRGGPGTSFDVVGTVTAGELVDVFSRTADGWIQIDEAGERWIGETMVELNGPIAEIGAGQDEAATPDAVAVTRSVPTPAATATQEPALPPTAGLSDWLTYEGASVGVQDMRWDYSLGYYRAERGKIYVSFYIVAVNNGESSQSFSDFDFELIDGGKEVTSGVVFGELDPTFSSCTVLPGGKCEGWWTTMIWDREEVKSDLTFVWDPPCIFCEDLTTPIVQEQ